jgi:hypothetical protein
MSETEPNPGLTDPRLTGFRRTDAGLTDSRLTDPRSTEPRLTDAGLMDAGLTDAGLTDAGLTDAGLTEAERADARLADTTLVRPFLVTGGRTRPLRDGLRIESLVSAQPAALSAPLRFELRRIVELCQQPRSVAEIAVRLGVPLGVARVLVADLVSGGYATCQEAAEIPIDVIERIRDRVRAL